MHILFTFVLIFCTSVASASGWHDYNLEIGDGYSIFKANSFDVNLAKNMSILVSNHRFDEIGPITHYYKDNQHIFLKTTGWRYRDLFDGDTFKEIDRTKEYYFIASVSESNIKGPLSNKAFSMETEVTEKENINWVVPKNPNFWTPLLGTLLFILVGLAFSYLKYWFVTVPVTLLIGFFGVKSYKNRHNKTNAADAVDCAADLRRYPER